MKSKLLTISLIILLSGCSKPQTYDEASDYFDNYCAPDNISRTGYTIFSGGYCRDAAQMIASFDINAINNLLEDKLLNKIISESIQKGIICDRNTDPYCKAIQKRLSQLGNNRYTTEALQRRYQDSEWDKQMNKDQAQAESQANLILEQAKN